MSRKNSLESKKARREERLKRKGNKLDRSKTYLGRIITPENRSRIHGELKAHFINVESKKEEYAEYSNEDIMYGAELYATHTIEREIRQLKAYLKGESFYTYKDYKYPVLGDKKAQFFSDFMQFKEENQEKLMELERQERAALEEE